MAKKYPYSMHRMFGGTHLCGKEKYYCIWSKKHLIFIKNIFKL